MSNDNTKTRPTHRVYAVTKAGEKKFWQPIGALWAHSDGKGFSLKLDLVPIQRHESHRHCRMARPPHDCPLP